MTIYGWDVLGPHRAQVSAGGTTTVGFSIPLKSASMTVIVPTLDGGATWKIQCLTPPGQDTETWTDVYWVGDSAGAPLALAGFGGTQAIVFSSEKMPAGVIRFVTSQTQNSLKEFLALFSQIQ